MLNHKDKESILSEFPNIKLSYENMIYKKVYNTDAFIAIPEGKKCFAWFTYFQDKPVCFIMELSENKQISNIKIATTCFSSELSYGTILYGTMFYHLSNNFFAIEDIFYYKGTDVSRKSWYDKFEFFKNMLDLYLKQIAYNRTFVVFGLPIMSNHFDTFKKLLDNIKYNINSIQFRLFNRCNNYLYMSYKSFLYEDLSAKPVTKVSNMKNIYKQPTLSKEYPKSNPRPKEVIFKIKPDIQNDIYNLYCNKDDYYGTAYIPDYITSVKMNTLFRNIKENRNLDALEESDDEEEFENDRIDKYVYLERELNMVCLYNYKFKKWYPIKIANNNLNIVSREQLLLY